MFSVKIHLFTAIGFYRVKSGKDGKGKQSDKNRFGLKCIWHPVKSTHYAAHNYRKFQSEKTKTKINKLINGRIKIEILENRIYLGPRFRPID